MLICEKAVPTGKCCPNPMCKFNPPSVFDDEVCESCDGRNGHVCYGASSDVCKACGDNS